MMKSMMKALHTGTTANEIAVISRLRSFRALKSLIARPRRRRRRSLALGSLDPNAVVMTLAMEMLTIEASNLERENT
jgi:hypothetical protein